jgi:hypothetical protein
MLELRTGFKNVPCGDGDMPSDEEWIAKRALADEALARNAAKLRAQADSSSDLYEDIVDSIHLAKEKKRHTKPPVRQYPLLRHLESIESADGEHETDVPTELGHIAYAMKLAEESDCDMPADIVDVDVDVVDSVRLAKTKRHLTRDHNVVLRRLDTQDSIRLEQEKHAHTNEFHRSNNEDGYEAASAP